VEAKLAVVCYCCPEIFKLAPGAALAAACLGVGQAVHAVDIGKGFPAPPIGETFNTPPEPRVGAKLLRAIADVDEQYIDDPNLVYLGLPTLRAVLGGDVVSEELFRESRKSLCRKT
jgi:hypothetical protein